MSLDETLPVDKVMSAWPAAVAVFLRLAKKVCLELMTFLYQLLLLLSERAYRRSVARFSLSSQGLNNF